MVAVGNPSPPPRASAAVENPAERDATFFRELSKDLAKNSYKLMELLVTRSPGERAGAAAAGAGGGCAPVPPTSVCRAAGSFARRRLCLCVCVRACVCGGCRTAIDNVYFLRYGKTLEDELLVQPSSDMRKTLLKLGTSRERARRSR